MYALLVDDEKRARESLLQMIQLYCPQITTLVEADSVTSAKEKIVISSPDILFLDIQLGDGTGFDLLRQMNTTTNIIFTTAYNQYAVKAFKFAAIDYLLKPIDPDELIEAIDKTYQKQQQDLDKERMDLFMTMMERKSNAVQKISLATNESIHIVNIEDIVFCEADRNYTTFHLLNGKELVISKSLREHEEMLPKQDFIRTHHSYLVNINHITRYEKMGNFLVSIDGSKIPVSVRKKEVVFQFLKKLK